MPDEVWAAHNGAPAVYVRNSRGLRRLSSPKPLNNCHIASRSPTPRCCLPLFWLRPMMILWRPLFLTSARTNFGAKDDLQKISAEVTAPLPKQHPWPRAYGAGPGVWAAGPAVRRYSYGTCPRRLEGPSAYYEYNCKKLVVFSKARVKSSGSRSCRTVRQGG